MAISKLVAVVALSAIVATGSAGVAAATPSTTNGHGHTAPVAQRVPIHGMADGVGYTVMPTAGGANAILDGGTFVSRAGTIDVLDDFGRVVASLPTTVDLGGRLMTLTESIAHDGSAMSVAAKITRIPHAQQVNGSTWLWRDLQRGAGGALVGAIIGILLPPGDILLALVGAVIGEFVVNGPDLLNAGEAFLSGR